MILRKIIIVSMNYLHIVATLGFKRLSPAIICHTGKHKVYYTPSSARYFSQSNDRCYVVLVVNDFFELNSENMIENRL